MQLNTHETIHRTNERMNEWGDYVIILLKDLSAAAEAHWTQPASQPNNQPADVFLMSIEQYEPLDVNEYK